MKKFLIPLFTFTFALHLCGATNLVSNTAIVTNRVQGIVTYTMSNGVARVQDPSGKLIGTAEERALKVAAEGQVDIASAAADAAGTAMEEWREFTATTDVKVVYIDSGFTQDLPALAPNLCGWVAGSFYDREKGEDHYYVWFNREIDFPPSMCARIVSESGTNWLDGAWKDWAVTNWIDKATGREFVMPTASDYVQDGLVAMWDGIENAGWGVHDPNATVWKDLVGVKDMTLVGATFDANSMVTRSNVNCYAYYEGTLFGSTATLEVIFTGDPCSVHNTIFTRYDDAFSIYTGAWSFKGPIQRPKCSPIEYKPLIATWDSASSGLFYQDGSGAKTVGSGYSGGGNGKWSICGQNDIHRFFGNIYSVRIYDRIITAEEIAHNYAIDAVRFGLKPIEEVLPLLAVPCRELVVPRRNASCVLKTGTVITLGGKDGFDADIHKVNIGVGGTPTATTSAQLPLFYAVTRSGTNTVTRAYTNGFVNVENGFVKEPSNE